MSTADPISEYLQELARGLSRVPQPQRDEWLREIRAHLEESAAHAEGDARERALEAVARFGTASEVAAGLQAEAMLEQGTRGFRPLLLARGLAAAYGTGWTLFALAFSLGYLVLIPIAMLTVAKLINPEAGLWLHPSGGWALSFHGFEGSREVLGWWLPVIGAAVSIGGWLALNRILRASLRRGLRHWKRAVQPEASAA